MRPVPVALGFALLTVTATAGDPLSSPPNDPDELLHRLCKIALGDEHLTSEVCTVQHDGGRNGDASDDCRDPYPPLPPDRTLRGMVLPPVPQPELALLSDREDNYRLDVAAGSTVAVSLGSAMRWDPLASSPVRYLATVHGPLTAADCGAALATVATDDGGATFTASAGGVYVLRVVPDENTIPGIWGAIPLVCHFSCFDNVSSVIGYQVWYNGTGP